MYDIRIGVLIQKLVAIPKAKYFWPRTVFIYIYDKEKVRRC